MVAFSEMRVMRSSYSSSKKGHEVEAEEEDFWLGHFAVFLLCCRLLLSEYAVREG